MKKRILLLLMCRACWAFHYMIIPGMGGSVLLEKNTKTQVWPPLNPFRLHEIHKIELQNIECEKIELHETGDLRSIRLSNYWTSLLIKNSYYDSMIDFLLAKNKRVHALPYDFRRIHHNEYLYRIFNDYKKYIGSKKEKTIIICHSLGGLVLYQFLMTMEKDWINKHIEHVFFICVPFTGTVESLHTVLTNDVNISNIPVRLETLRFFGGFLMTLPTDHGRSVIRYNQRLFPMGKRLFEIFGLEKCYEATNNIRFDRRASLGVGSTLIISDNVLTRSLIDMDNLDKSVYVRGDGLVTNDSLMYPFYHWKDDIELIRIADTDHGRICENKKTMSYISDYSS